MHVTCRAPLRSAFLEIFCSCICVDERCFDLPVCLCARVCVCSMCVLQDTTKLVAANPEMQIPDIHTSMEGCFQRMKVNLGK